MAFGFVLLVPTWLVLPPDDEDLPKEVLSTVFQSRELLSGRYPFWYPWVGFGVPQPPVLTLVFHPFMVFVQLLPLGAAIGALYQLQVWIGIGSVWALARHFDIRRSIAGLCVFTYGLSSMMLVYLTNFWPVNLVDWTLAPLLLLLLLKLLEAEERAARAVFAVATGLTAGFMVLDGHVGLLIDYGIPFLVFLAAQAPRLFRIWRWLLLSLGVAAMATAGQVYAILLETSRAVTSRAPDQATVSMNFWRLIIYPLSSPRLLLHPIASAANEGNTSRALAIGGPFFLLTAVGLGYPLRRRYVNGLRAAIVASLVLWFVPPHWTAIRSDNYTSGAAFTIFAVLLAGLTLQALWRRFPAWHGAIVAVALLQVVVLVAGFYPYYRNGLTEAAKYLSGNPSSQSLKRSLENQPIYRYFERQPGIGRTRIYLAAGADRRLFFKAADYKFPGWSLHNLRLVNGFFKGVDMHEIAPARVYLRGEIRGDNRVSSSALTLDALNIGYLVATPTDPVAKTLAPIREFHLSNPRATIIAYRNPAAWPDAVILAPRAKNLGLLPRRNGCSTPGLLCADFSPVANLRQATGIQHENWIGTDLSVTFTPEPNPRVLMLTQLYRPGWQATLSNGHTIDGYSLFRGFTGFTIPARATTATISYQPTTRTALTILTWTTILLSLLAIPAIALSRRKHKNRTAARTGPIARICRPGA
jgi:hypothetical protein